MNDIKAFGVIMKGMRMQAVLLVLLLKGKSLVKSALQENPGCMSGAEVGFFILGVWNHF